MSVGTRSLLFGAHQFLLHPLLLAWAWTRLYGFPFDPRLWVAFFVHDLGYIGKEDIDGASGEDHPYLGARIMGFLFGEEWRLFTLYHSRSVALKEGGHSSRLCVADKLAIVLMPTWLFVWLSTASGEVTEYLELSSPDGDAKYSGEGYRTSDAHSWFEDVRVGLSVWVDENKDSAASRCSLSPRNAA